MKGSEGQNERRKESKEGIKARTNRRMKNKEG
jgi:hypothetical protein